VNDARKRAMARKVAAALGGNLRGKTIAVARPHLQAQTPTTCAEAPSIPLIIALKDMGASVRAYDPAGMANARAEFPDIAFTDGPYACAQGADALVIRDRMGAVPRARSRPSQERR